MVSDVKRLGCPHCGRPRDLFSILDHCDRSWQGRRWLDFRCPDCGEASWVELEGSRAAIGFVRQPGAPRFEPHMRVDEPGLEARLAPDGMWVHLYHRRWYLVARAPSGLEPFVG
jgi:predicted RNA-binding Zn-ribbon protein involved in translation (DUF1610 family)